MRASSSGREARASASSSRRCTRSSHRGACRTTLRAAPLRRATQTSSKRPVSALLAESRSPATLYRHFITINPALRILDHKAIRLVHPDKVAPTATLEAQIEAQKIFAVLSEAYKKYTEAEGSGGAGAGLASFTTTAQSARRPAGGPAADMPSFGSFGAGSSGISGAAARARAAFNAMHSATRGPTAPSSTAGGSATAGGPGAGSGGIRFTSFSAHTGYHASGMGSTSWAGGAAGGSATSR